MQVSSEALARLAEEAMNDVSFFLRKAHLEKVGEGFQITRIHLTTEAEVPGIDEAEFQETAEGAKKNCPVSQALAGVEIVLDAKLVS